MHMNEYAVISGTSLICVVKARNPRSAAKKALARLAEEYKKRHNVKILKFAGNQKSVCPSGEESLRQAPL